MKTEKIRRYYTVLENVKGHYEIAFGDYDKKVVQQEIDDISYSERRKKDFKIVSHWNNEIVELNGDLDYVIILASQYSPF